MMGFVQLNYFNNTDNFQVIRPSIWIIHTCYVYNTLLPWIKLYELKSFIKKKPQTCKTYVFYVVTYLSYLMLRLHLFLFLATSKEFICKTK